MPPTAPAAARRRRCRRRQRSHRAGRAPAGSWPAPAAPRRRRSATPARRARRRCARSSPRAPGLARSRPRRRPRSARSHSIAIEPHPAPISHSVSPGSGASRARVIARISRLVNCPSCSKASSGSPASRDSGAGAGRHRAFERDRVEVGAASARPNLRRAVLLPPRARRRDARTRSSGSAPSRSRRAGPPHGAASCRLPTAADSAGRGAR